MVALVACATVAGGGVALSAPAIAHADPTSCAATFNLLIPGTGETSENADPSRPVGMLAPVAEAIERENVKQAEIYVLPYMSHSAGDGADVGFLRCRPARAGPGGVAALGTAALRAEHQCRRCCGDGIVHRKGTRPDG
nr:hypothetical protein GCM10017611_12670 [Rhodococcus wratislaviensis]